MKNIGDQNGATFRQMHQGIPLSVIVFRFTCLFLPVGKKIYIGVFYSIYV